MTENKADKALRKVTINLAPSEYIGMPIPNEAFVEIDVSDKLEEGKKYYLDNIKIDYDNWGNTIRYISYNDYEAFKKKIENILDATIVNNKQRESIQKLLNEAFWASTKYNATI